MLRKPGFQRETNHWTPVQVVSLIQCFVEGDLIPSVILWSSPTSVFVIDGGIACFAEIGSREIRNTESRSEKVRFPQLSTSKVDVYVPNLGHVPSVPIDGTLTEADESVLP